MEVVPMIALQKPVRKKKSDTAWHAGFLAMLPAIRLHAHVAFRHLNEEARDVASMENSVLGFEIENYNEYLKQIINRIVDIEYRRESMKLAQYIQSGIEVSLGNETTSRGVKSAFFYVLKAVKMPSVLIEIGFVTNSRESQNLLNPQYTDKIANGIADGIVQFTEVFSESEGFTK